MTLSFSDPCNLQQLHGASDLPGLGAGVLRQEARPLLPGALRVRPSDALARL